MRYLSRTGSCHLTTEVRFQGENQRDIVKPRFELNQVFDAWQFDKHPSRVRQKPGLLAVRTYPSVETIFDEQAKHSVLLIDVIEESANMTLAGDITVGKPYGLTCDCHVSPRCTVDIQIFELGSRVEANPTPDLTICLLRL